MTVTIGSAADGYQTQIGASKKDHIADVNCPLYGKKVDVAADTNPRIQMKHLSALLAIKLVNKTGKEVTIEHIAVESSTNPIVGKFNVNFVGDTPVVTKTQAESESSKMAILVPYLDANASAPGIKIAAGTEATPTSEKFYMAVAPTTDKFTVYVNGTPITKDVSIELAAGKVTTIKVNIPAIQGTLTSLTTKTYKTSYNEWLQWKEKDASVNFITWDESSSEPDQMSINGNIVNVYSVNDGTIRINGAIEAYLGGSQEDSSLPISFFAASKVSLDETSMINNVAKLEINTINVELSVTLLGYTYPINKAITKKGLQDKLGDTIPLGFELAPIGLFNDSLGNLILLNEQNNHYYLDETKANTLLATALEDYSISMTVERIRDAIYDNDMTAWEELFNMLRVLAPGQFEDGEALGTIVGLVENSKTLLEIFGHAVRHAEVSVELTTTGEAAFWGMNVNQ